MINTCTRTFGIVNNSEVNRIDAKIYYDLGGWNMWQGGNEGRGYWFSIGEYKFIDHGTFSSIEFSLKTDGTHGVKCLVEPVKRQSKKRYEMAKARLDELVERFLEPYCNEHGLELGELIEEKEEEE